MTKKGTKQKDNIVSFVPDGSFYYERAIRALNKEDRMRAKLYFERAYTLDPTDVEGMIEYALFQIEESHFAEAYELLQRIQILDPSKDEVIYYLAEVHAHLGLLVQAREYANEYLDVAFDGPFGEEAEAIIEFADQEGAPLIEEDMDSEVFFMQEKAQRKMEKGDYAGAADVFENLVAEYPEVLAASNNLALSYFYTNRLEEAKELLYDVLEEDAGNVHALCNLAVFYYYERNTASLKMIVDVLKKIYPIPLEHQFKIGATFGLIGEYEDSYERLRRIEPFGYRDDIGFYFWLSQAAYYAGYEEEARRAHDRLVELDPSKDGAEPWINIEKTDGLEDNFDHVLAQLSAPLPSKRLYGLFLLGKTAHRQAILTHAHHIDFDDFVPIEQLYFVYALDKKFVEDHDEDDPQLRSIEVAEQLYTAYAPLEERGDLILRQWFSFLVLAYGVRYAFRNPSAIAAAFDYNQNAQLEKVTKKQFAEKYGTTVPTLTKYLKQLLEIYRHR